MSVWWDGSDQGFWSRQERRLGRAAEEAGVEGARRCHRDLHPEELAPDLPLPVGTAAVIVNVAINTDAVKDGQG